MDYVRQIGNQDDIHFESNIEKIKKYFKRKFFEFNNPRLNIKFLSKFSNLFYIEVENKLLKVLRFDSSGIIL